MVERPSQSFDWYLGLAYRRACRAGMAQVGTDLVLLYATVSVPSSWDHVHSNSSQSDGGRYGGGRTGLVDPQPPARTMWEDAFDAKVAFEAEAPPRDAALAGSDRLRYRYRHRRALPPMPVFSPAVRYAAYEAIHEAGRLGVEHAARSSGPGWVKAGGSRQMPFAQLDWLAPD